MTAPSAAPKSNVLIQQLQRMSHAPVLNEVELARITREARALLKVDTSAYAILGIIASERGDEAEARRQFNAAERSGAPLDFVSMNFGIALARLGNPYEGLAQIERVNDIEEWSVPDDVGCYAQEAVACGEFEKATRAFDRLKQLGRDVTTIRGWDKLQFATELGLDPEVVRQANEAVLALIRERIPRVSMSTRMDADADSRPPYFQIDHCLRGVDVDTLVDMSVAIAELFSREETPSEWSDGLVITVSDWSAAEFTDGGSSRAAG